MKFQYTLRELVMLGVIVALAIGWWMDAKDIRGYHRTFCANCGDKIVSYAY